MSILVDYFRFLSKNRNFVMVLLWAFYLTSYLRGLLLKLPIVSSFTDIIIVLLISIPLIFSLPFFFKQPIVHKCIFIYFALCTFYILNDVVYPENSAVLEKNLTRCLFTTFPFIIYGSLIDIRKYFNAFYLTSIVCIALDAFYFLLFNKNGISASGVESDHNMVAAYALLPHVLLCIVAALRNFKVWKLLVAFAGSLMLVSYGTRGPIACFLVFMVSSLVLYRKSFSKTSVAVLIAVSILLLVFFNQIITVLVSVIGNKMGMSTRVLDLFLTNSIAVDEARNQIIATLFDRLKYDHRVFGFGLLGSYNFTGGYPHNFFVDILFSFGYLVGGLLLALLGIFSFKAFRISGIEEKSFFLVLFCSGFMHLLFSGTFVFEADFFIFLGFLIRLLNQTKPYEQTESLCKYRL